MQQRFWDLNRWFFYTTWAFIYFNFISLLLYIILLLFIQNYQNIRGLLFFMGITFKMMASVEPLIPLIQVKGVEKLI
jgi:hypothetical protein